MMAEHIVNINEIDDTLSLYGNFDENIKYIEKSFDVSIILRGDEIKILGESENIKKASRTINNLVKMMKQGHTIDLQIVVYVVSLVGEDREEETAKIGNNIICISSRGKPIKTKTIGQKNYINAISQNTVIFGIGPAGTGKTYLAVAMAVKALKSGEVHRIILTRPAVEAGEKLGFLPGDLQSKVDPYLRPLYDSLQEMLGGEAFQKHLERGTIEVAPLAYMRGRTLDDAFIILDEAQNTTKEQMKMFLTRFGFNSKAVITGDITQIDIPNKGNSGLKDAVKTLKDIESIEIVNLTDKDVVRHRIVQLIVKAYESKAQQDIENI